jgi:hypothetical protein
LINSISSGSLLFIPLQFHCSILRLYVLSASEIFMLVGDGGLKEGRGLEGVGSVFAGGAGTGTGCGGGLGRGSFLQAEQIQSSL